MITRFDNDETWITENNDYDIEDMETAHILNTIRLFILKPNSVIGMLIKDVEENEIEENTTVWSKTFLRKRNIKKESINNITSMTDDEVKEYVMSSPLVNAMKIELEKRGVNVENIILKIKNENGGAF